MNTALVSRPGRAAIGAALALAMLAGCAATAPNYEARAGEAVRASRQAQVLNPAPADDPAPGMDGPAAREAVLRYQDSFKAPPPVVNVISIGGTR